MQLNINNFSAHFININLLLFYVNKKSSKYLIAIFMYEM